MSCALILGGARSGKSRIAEARALATGGQPWYIATAWGADTHDGDIEMQQRVAQHKKDRGDAWQLIEEQTALGGALRSIDQPGRVILVDCLTLWLNNCLHHKCWAEQRQALLDCLPALTADVIFVSNEVGSGIVPLGALSRTFADEAGWLNQRVAEHCERVDLVVAGLEMRLKSP
ncbi:bifunctional adenosylcobinamide kinase/adenosylcobinamide-phosphate guanylyltransferase [Marinagarivorans algicola]|uniref:bifunctional adenosylcobinamide kinase/adenosylcobinamide-phosphate guanylyltransferase n=1 Tax=Marinagarivorans algicola TaxID=1513270 RepID=UPI0006B98DB6|nr:bifunctional adenosylcobinamide kinase/adenosylcobinamide-phosphate guanylyltransferase [Marinagarivorans algicola]